MARDYTVLRFRISRFFLRPVQFFVWLLWKLHPYAVEDWFVDRVDDFDRESIRCIEDWVDDARKYQGG